MTARGLPATHVDGRLADELLQVSPRGLLVLGRNLTVTFANAAPTALVGVDAGSTARVGRPLHQVLPPNAAQERAA